MVFVNQQQGNMTADCVFFRGNVFYTAKRMTNTSAFDFALEISFLDATSIQFLRFQTEIIMKIVILQIILY